MVTSLFARVGPEGNLFDPTAAPCRTIHLDNPVILDADLARADRPRTERTGPTGSARPSCPRSSRC
ncbi:MAG: hypothetical protein R2695_10635 [Acidimicrobiales bacterium]